jgi:carbamoyltransferase
MKHYMGVGGEMLHDAGITIIDENGDIKFASMYERFSGKKHDAVMSKEFLKEWSTRYPNTSLYTNDDWAYRLKFRTDFLTPSADAFSELSGKEDLPWSEGSELHKKTSELQYELALARKMGKRPTRKWWGQHPAERGDIVTACEHHRAHASAAFATRPKSFAKEECVMLVIDGVGEMRSSATYNHDLELVEETNFPRSVGYLYANFTDKMPGLRSNDDEYVVMGLSCYGEPTHWEKAFEMYKCVPSWTLEDQDGFENVPWQEKYRIKTLFLSKIIDFLLRETKNEKDAAASLQRMTEEVIYEFATKARKYGNKLCYSGGVAQNIMANNRIRELFDDVWIDVNPGDGGGSLGAAAYFYMKETGADRINWEHPYLGYEIEGWLDPEMVVDYLLKKKVCGVANGPAEFSYRAYGNRSLLGDVRYDVKDTVNNIKQRQLYRPFAPAILEEHVDDYFEGYTNRWMQFSAQAKHDYGSVTHVDGSGRVQLVHKDSQSALRKILECYYDRTGVPMLLNTSLNIRGKPMVNNRDQATAFENMYNVKVFTS